MPLGGLVTLAILLPNLLLLAFPPKAVPPHSRRKENLPRLMEGIERVGQIGTCAIPFFYPIPALRGAAIDALVVMAVALLFYYSGWARYTIKGQRFVLLYAPFLKVPLPMAIGPIIYFAAASVFLRAWPLAVAVLLLAAGHLYVSQGAYQRCRRYAYN